MKHHWITSGYIGQLQPCFIQEVTPGDTWAGKTTVIARLAPLDSPTFMQLKSHIHFFYVPHRLVWDEFPEVFAGTDTSTAWPTLTYGIAGAQWQRFGLPVNTSSTPTINALPVRAFNLIYNEFFRNPHLESARALGEVTSPARVRFPSNGYFGSLQDEIQQGSEETVDSSGATIGVTAIRDAMNRQRWAERRALFGERYRDVLLSDYGVRASDKSLDRPEHCAAGSFTMGISEVVATATSASEETGEIRGHGIGGTSIRFKPRYFEEPGTLMGVVVARPRLQLATGNPHWTFVQDREDLHLPQLASDTDVTVSSGEIFSNAASYSNFAYHPKDQWLRKTPDVIAGSFVAAGGTYSNYTAPVELSSTPTLSYLQQVQDYDQLFQDQTASRIDLSLMFSHSIGKKSLVKPPRKR